MIDFGRKLLISQIYFDCMKFVVLVDNSPGGHEGLVAEHGFALWMEVDGLKWLVDTGASDTFAQNATQLGID